MSPFFPALACAQLHIQPGAPDANFAALADMLGENPLPSGALVVLPEMWATGFVYPETARLAAKTPRILEAMRELAAQHRILLAGSLTARDADASRPVNRLFVVGAKGVLGHADKQHLFTAWHEDTFYRPGPASRPIPTHMGSVGAMVCYDLRFPEVARNLAHAGARVLIVSAEWPHSRLTHWRALTQARAIENQCWLLACNACGQTGELRMAGHSLIVAPNGDILAEAGETTGLLQELVEEAELAHARQYFCTPAERPWRGADSDKILSLSELLPRVTALRERSGRASTIAFTNGCFDILHSGHVAYLEEARRAADCLVVGLNSDVSVRLQGKGPGRPVNPQADRARVLAALGCVDFVVLFDEPTPLALIKALLPDVLVKGADWPEERIAGAAEVKAAGGALLRIPLAEGRSTTAIIRRIQEGAPQA